MGPERACSELRLCCTEDPLPNSAIIHPQCVSVLLLCDMLNIIPEIKNKNLLKFKTRKFVTCYRDILLH